MCIICVKNKGINLPSKKLLKSMFISNPDGAGFMYTKDGNVYIEKGFMEFEDLEKALNIHNFTKDDVIVYHFRISTQGGVRPELSHPYPLTKYWEKCLSLDLMCKCGIVHNGIIRMTSDYKETRFNDTIKFITEYLIKLVRNSDDLKNANVLEMIEHLTNSKWALLDGSGTVATIGNFINDKGLLFSNSSYLTHLNQKPFAKMDDIIDDIDSFYKYYKA